jgi:hypothetical protein
VSATPNPAKSALIPSSATELKVAEALVQSLATRFAEWSSGDRAGAAKAEAKDLGALGLRTSAIVQYFFCAFLSPKAFVTDASLRS